MQRSRVRRCLAVGAGAATALGLVPLAAAPAASATAGVFFSEYIEGSSNNKALEIYNGSGGPVDLSTYRVEMFFNGNTSVGTTITLTGTLAPGDVYVVADDNASEPILAQADLTSTASFFNGDDAIVLRSGSTLLDVIGQVGVDPGSQWGDGLASTADNTLRRKPTITAGDPDGTNEFIPSEEWEGFATDTFDGLGSHTAGPPVDTVPTVTSTVPVAGATGVPADQALSVTFSEDVDTTDGAFTLECDGATVPVTVSGGPRTFTIDPSEDLATTADCVLTISAARVTDRDGTADAMDGDVVVDFSVTSGNVCDDPFTPVYEIQGSGEAAAVTGDVTTEGVVVGDYEGPQPNLRGFYLQDPEGDGNPATSDGIFVFNGSEDEVDLGDVVRVTGTAGEFQGQTQISADPDGVVVCGEGGTVEPTEVTLPFDSLAEKEQYEGMLVEFPQTLYVTEHFQLGRFGQVLLSSEDRLDQPTNVVAPGTEANQLQQANDLNQILVDDTLQVQNPDPIIFGRGGEPLSADNTLRGGDSATGITGVLTYTWGGNSASPNEYRVRPVSPDAEPIDFQPTNPRPAEPEDVGGDLQVASFNVLNYFNTFNDDDDETFECSGGVGGEPMDCRGADDALELDRQADKIVAAILGLDAEIVGVIEIENDGYGPDSAIQDLVNRLNAEAGTGTYAFIDADEGTGETNALGTDAIKVGLLYKPAEVTPVGQTAALNTEEFVNAIGDEERNRPALAQTFADEDGGQVTVVVNHLKSKGSDCEPLDPNTGDGQGNCNLTRTAAAEELAEWLAGDPTGVADPDVLIIGDLNAYAQEDPIVALQEAGYVDLIEAYEGPGAYSYVFDGQWGYLDHALASASLVPQVTGTTVWHINADEPNVLDYNTNFKSDSQVEDLYDDGPYRSSDHDPVLVGLDLDAPPVADAGGPYTVRPGRWVTLSAAGSSDPDGDELTYTWDLDGDGDYDDASGETARFRGNRPPGTYPVSVQVSDGTHTATDDTTVSVVPPGRDRRN